MTDITLVVMAAGMGSRYGGLKQLEKVGPNGETIMDYSIMGANKAGFHKAVFIIRPDMEASFIELTQRWKNLNIEIDYTFQEAKNIPERFQLKSERIKPWGTGHALLCAKKKIDTPFALINADDYYGDASYKQIAQFLRENKDDKKYAMVSFLLQNTLSPHGTVSRGVCQVNSSNILVKIKEYNKLENKNGKFYSNDILVPEIKEDTPVSMNFWGFKPNIFSWAEKQFCHFLEDEKLDFEKDEFYIPTVIYTGITSGVFEIEILKTHSKWLGMTYKEDFNWVKQTLAEDNQ